MVWSRDLEKAASRVVKWTVAAAAAGVVPPVADRKADNQYISKEELQWQ